MTYLIEMTIIQLKKALFSQCIYKNTCLTQIGMGVVELFTHICIYMRRVTSQNIFSEI